ncbi:MAG: strawberry notch C-terminal domain-containing protein [Chitinophagaceae bacterium]
MKKTKRKYDSREKKIKAVKQKGQIVTFKEKFNWMGEYYLQIGVEGFRKQGNYVKIIGFGKDSPWYDSMDSLLEAVDWEWMEEAHDFGDAFGGYLNNILSENERGYLAVVGERLREKASDNKRTLEKLASSFNITDKTKVKELTELAIVNRARELAHSEGNVKDRFDKIVELYYSQVNLSHRTSQSILLQQYSTPAPIGYLAGVFCELDKLQFNGGFAFEPSAGNGLLTIAAKPERVYVNEIDPVRNRNLLTQGFADVTALDATKPFAGKQGLYRAVLTNPPFGNMEAMLYYETFGIKALEHVMALRALDTMASYGKAAIIIGGHTRWDDKGRVQAGKQRIFLNYLYSRYNVADIININGHKLYSRQGTAFDVRLILINGRKKTPFGNAPVYNVETDKEVNTFDELFERVMDATDQPLKVPIVGEVFLPLYQLYTSLKPKHHDAVLFVRNGEHYYSFGDDATQVIIKAGFGQAGELHYEGKKLRIAKFDAARSDYYLAVIRNSGLKAAIADKLESPNIDNMKRMELEAEALALELELLNTLGDFPAVPGNVDKTMYQNYIYYKAGHASRSYQLYLVLNQRTGEYETYDLDAERINYIFSVPLTLFAIIKGKKVYGLSLTADQVAAFRKKLQDTGYQVLQNENPHAFTGIDTTDPDDFADHDQLFIRYKELRTVFPGELLLLETPGTFVAFNEDAITLAKTLRIGHIKTKGPDYEYTIAGISKIVMAGYLETLKNAGIEYALIPNGKPTNWKKLEDEAFFLKRWMDGEQPDLGAPYIPASDACIVLNTEVPDSMAFETHEAVKFAQDKVGGDMDNFVRHRLRYPNKAALCKVLSAEQIDAVAMAIYNIEARGQGMIIGDQTGIGKGRIAASMIRYAVLQGLKPVFLTEKANLFSDIYRDLAAIGSAHLRPFIVNNRESKTDIKDEDGEIIYQAPPVSEQQNIIASREVPPKYDFVLATYTQFNSAEKKPEKPNFLRAIAADNIFIMDEAHNSSGSSNTGEFMQGVIRHTKGVVFLSATFAKRPDNMPIYAMKTAIADCNMTKDDLVAAITKGGVALQEVLSSQLVAEGQMMRRERSFEGVEVNYISLDDKAEEHRAISDNITKILRDIIAFQGLYIDKMVEELDNIAVAEGKEISVREGTSQAGVDNLPYFSKVFQVINQMLFSLKAEAVAEQAIARLKEGKKPVIAFASTMGSFIESMETEHGLPVSDGDMINTDFAEVLRRGLDGIMRYTEKDIDGNPVYKRFELNELSKGAQQDYQRIMEKIMTVSTGISISPIDVIIKKLKDAGYSVAEVTGRKYEVQVNLKTGKGIVLARKRINTNDAFRQFNNNEVDVLMINQSGSTGASAHAIPTAKVPAGQVRQRAMIVLQAELDISTEVQKRGRINRTGQILKPIYDYVTSAIPAEKRLMMMLQKKLKSLDANTTSNQKQSTKILDVPDFLNKYGDKIVKEYLMENKDINDLLDDPLHLSDSGEDSDGRSAAMEEAAHRVSGRVAVLSTKMQEDFYNEIAERYNDYVDYMKQVGEYDLEVEAMNLEAETTASRVIKMGKGSDSAFGDDSVLETVKANVLKKPFSKSELENLINESLKGKEPQEIQQEYIRDYKTGIEERLAKEQADAHAKYDMLRMSIAAEKKIQKILEKEGEAAWHEAIEQRQQELDQAREAQLAAIERTFENRRHYIVKTMNFFYPGRLLSYPVDSYDGGKESVPAVFLGLVIDKKKKNPYAPSAMKLRFAIANSSKYLAMPASYNEEILAIIGSSADTTQPAMNVLLHEWEEYTKQNNVDRKIRHIITGNLLQAFSDFKGKLVSYTTGNKETRKGILLPENWNPGEQVQDKIVVPILKALPLIKSITQNGQIVTNNGISFFRKGDDYKIVVSASRSKGGDIYLDKDILELVEKNNFEKTSTSMVAMLPAGNIEKLVEILQANHSCSVTVHSAQVRDLKLDTGGRYSNRKPILLPDEESNEETPDNINLLELEAEALILELELLAA